jgi:aubergine-like protein
VCIKTISSGKGLRSICNKILVQINAKVGGIPWTIDEMPFNDKPTVI